jgi:hypothetical protein
MLYFCGQLPVHQHSTMEVIWEAIHRGRSAVFERRCSDIQSLFAALCESGGGGRISRARLRSGLEQLEGVAERLGARELDRLVATVQDTEALDRQGLEAWLRRREAPRSSSSSSSSAPSTSLAVAHRVAPRGLGGSGLSFRKLPRCDFEQVRKACQFYEGKCAGQYESRAARYLHDLSREVQAATRSIEAEVRAPRYHCGRCVARLQLA